MRASAPLRKNAPRVSLFSRIILLCVLLPGMFPAAARATEPQTIRVGAFNFYPAIFKDTDDVVKGFYVDTLAEVARRENLRIEYVYGSWADGLARIQNGEIDLLTSVAYTAERAKSLDYGKTPLLTVWGELYVPVSSGIDNITKMEGKTVAVMKNDFNGLSFIDMAEKFGITIRIVEVAGFEEVFKAVASKRVDAGVVNNTFGVPKHGEYHLRSTGVVFNPFDIFFAVAKGKNGELLDLLDDYLVSWHSGKDPVYIRARQQWAHGTATEVHIVPRWLLISLAVLGFLMLLATAFILLLRKQVARATLTIMQREESLRQSNEMTQLLLDSTAEAIFGLDLDGVCTFCNAACLKLLGYDHADQLVGKNMHRRMHYAHTDGQPLAEENCTIMQIHRTGEAIHVDNEVFWRANGTPFPVEYRAVPIRQNNGIIGSVVTFLDATERKKIEESYRFLSQSGYGNRSENFFPELVEHLAESLSLDWVCINRLTGKQQNAQPVATYHNGTLIDNPEYSLEGTPCRHALERSICCFTQGVQTLFPRATLLQQLEAQSFIGATLWSADGHPIGLIAGTGKSPLENGDLAQSILKLVSLRTAAELERMDAREALMQKNLEIERFTYAVSHDLKSPLITIKTFLNYLGQDLADKNPAMVEKDMGFILAAADKMSVLLDELLRMSRVGRLTNPPVTVALTDLLDGVLATLAGAIKEKGVDIVVATDGHTLHGDPLRLAEIWQNLIDNAIKYMGTQPSPRIEVGVTSEDGETVFYVRDNGMGIDPRHAHKVFGMFEKVDPLSEGSGLGLALVKKIVELYKGRIWLESDGCGHGSRFLFSLPDACNRQGDPEK